MSHSRSVNKENQRPTSESVQAKLEQQVALLTAQVARLEKENDRLQISNSAQESAGWDIEMALEEKISNLTHERDELRSELRQLNKTATEKLFVQDKQLLQAMAMLKWYVAQVDEKEQMRRELHELKQANAARPSSASSMSLPPFKYVRRLTSSGASHASTADSTPLPSMTSGLSPSSSPDSPGTPARSPSPAPRRLDSQATSKYVPGFIPVDLATLKMRAATARLITRPCPHRMFSAQVPLPVFAAAAPEAPATGPLAHPLPQIASAPGSDDLNSCPKPLALDLPSLKL